MKIIENLSIQPQWQSVESGHLPKLEHGELHLWSLPLQLDTTQEQQALSWLSALQHSKYKRRRTPELKQAYIAGRYYLLTLLAHYSAQSPESIKLSYTRLNKPYLTDGTSHLHFNFTDTSGQNGSTAMLAFSRASELGVDIESLSRRSNFKAIVEKRFTAAEQNLVTDRDGEVDPELFLCLWTRKEASGKAIGQGINFKMNQRQLIQGIAIHEETADLDYFDENSQPWRLTQVRISDEYIGCVAYSGHSPLNICYFNKLL